MKRNSLYLVSLLISVLPLYGLRFRVGYFPTTLLEVVFLLTFLVWSLEVVRAKRFKTLVMQLGQNPFFKPSIVFVTGATLAIFFSPDIYKALGIYRAYILEPVVVFLIIFDLILELGISKVSKYVLNSLILSGIYLSVYGLYQFLTSSNAIAPLEAEQGRVTSLFNHPTFLTMYLGPVSILTLAKASQSGVKNRLLFVFLIFSFLIVIYLTKSVGGYLGVITGFALYLGKYFYDQKSRYIRSFLKYSFFTVIIGLLLGLGYLFVNLSNLTPHYGLVWPRPDKSTTTIRLCVWEGTRNLLQEKPLTGAGLSGFFTTYPSYQTCDTEHFTYPHNLILNFWTETGLLGLIGFGYLLFIFAGVLFEISEKSTLAYGLLGAMAYWLVHGLVDVPYFKNDLSMFFWIILALSTGLLPKRKKKES